MCRVKIVTLCTCCSWTFFNDLIIFLAGGKTKRRSSSDATDTDEETDHEAAAGEMNQSMANPDQRHRDQETNVTTSGGHEGEEGSGAEERKLSMASKLKLIVVK